MAVTDDRNEQLHALGAFIRAQRRLANLSLRQMADLAHVSNPYLSQLERGLHEPSVRVLQSIGRALDLSAETLLTQAGLLDPNGDEPTEPLSTEAAIRRDASSPTTRSRPCSWSTAATCRPTPRRADPRTARRGSSSPTATRLACPRRSRKKWFAPGTTSRRASGIRDASSRAVLARTMRSLPAASTNVGTLARGGATAMTTIRARRAAATQ